MRRYQTDTSKGVSRFSFYTGILFCVIGVGMCMSVFFLPDTPIIAVSGLAWMLIAVPTTVKAYKNGFSKEGSWQDGYNTYRGKKGSREFDFEEKIRKLERLKEEKLISEEEYEMKRAEILQRKW